MPCFAVNTKLGTAMIDSLGGADRVNNVLAALNLKPISQKNLKMIERRAGNFVESIAKSSMSKAAKDSFELEMEDVGNEESKKAQEEMGEEIDGLGVSLFHDASPSVKKLVCRESAALQSPELLKDGTDVPGSSRTVKDIFKGRAKLKKRAPCQPSQQQSLKCKKKLALEGDTYQSEIGLEDEVDIVQIPDPVPRGVFKPITLSSGSPSLVVFDLETTDLIRGRQMPHITQLAAVELDTGSLYNTYILPKVPISEEAMNTTGIVVNSDLEKMTVHDTLLPVVSGFIDSLSVFKKAFLDSRITSKRH
uniref:Exonuclease domain-containing protein n=1 Tax=Magallana gigas TaxID=29159 RepID=A0A8W8NP81_MAGGI